MSDRLLSKRIGVIGVGVISTAFITGVLTLDPKRAPLHSITLSPRGSVNVAMLLSRFPNGVKVASSNQDVVNCSDVIVLSVLEPQVPRVLSALQFRSGQLILNFTPTSEDTVRRCIQPAEVEHIKVIPLPPIAHHVGLSLVCPKHQPTVDLFNLLGKAFAVSNEKDKSVLCTITCLMGPFYNLLANVAEWAEEQGIRSQTAGEYTAYFFDSIVKDAVKGSDQPGGFKKLVREQTPGGFNECANRQLEQSGVFAEYRRVLDYRLSKM